MIRQCVFVIAEIHAEGSLWRWNCISDLDLLPRNYKLWMVFLDFHQFIITQASIFDGSTCAILMVYPFWFNQDISLSIYTAHSLHLVWVFDLEWLFF